MFNLYGITEVSCWSSCALVNGLMSNDQDKIASEQNYTEENFSGSVPLGKALMGTIVEVRDDNGQVITHDGVGMIWMGM